MRIFIITMDDPLQTNQFIRQIINARRDQIVGLAVSRGGRLKPSKSGSKVVYLFTLLLIMGIFPFLRNVLITLRFKILKYLSKFDLTTNPSIIQFAKEQGIDTFKIKSPNGKAFVSKLKSLKPDVIINQSQSILKDPLLSIPTIGTINRHNALLPKNRGRLTPFWVLFHKERETGVSIHFVERAIDSGDIIVQKRFQVSKKENFNSLVVKNYQVAGEAMLEALEKLEQSPSNGFSPNDDNLATYNFTPTFKEALRYRLDRLI